MRMDKMRMDKRIKEKGVIFNFIKILFLLLFLVPLTGFTQEAKEVRKETLDKFSNLIENGARMIRENEIEKVFNLIEDLPQEKRGDFRVRVIKNFANLKAYLISKNKEYGKKWQEDYKPLCFTGDKTATSILIDLLRDNDPYMRAFTLRALGFLGDQTALEPIKNLANQDPNEKVRLRAREAFKRITGYDLPRSP
jgi:HEAT repeat protein